MAIPSWLDTVRRGLVLALLVASPLPVLAAWTVIVPAAAGGGSDTSARVFAKYAQKKLKVPVIVQNVPGEGGYRGSRQVAESTPGQQVLLYTHAGIVTNFVSGKAPYAYERFQVLGQLISDETLALMVRGDDPIARVADLIDEARRSPATLAVATEYGAYTYFMLASLQRQFGLSFLLADVGGDTAKLRALLTGQVRVIPRVVGGTRAYLADGEIRALGLVASERPASARDVPTLQEQGVPFSFPPFPFMLFAPAHLPAGAVSTLRAMVREVTQDPGFRSEIEAASMAVRYRDPAATLSLLADLKQRFSELIAPATPRPAP
ncbi:MAG: hypothetical protein KDG55_00775 [Rhodocyclaceae bacterium]|nr:hypothetical protein [Rhodocyclaceae bacterium]